MIITGKIKVNQKLSAFILQLNYNLFTTLFSILKSDYK